MSIVRWNNWGSMRPKDSAAVGGSEDNPNPVTLIENLIHRDDGVLVRRSGFTAGTGSIANIPDNHINARPIDLDRSTLVIKADTQWYYATSVEGGWTELTYSNGSADGSNRGSFGVFNGDIYYTDKGVSWRWDGTTVAQTGMPYFNDPNDYPDWSYDVSWVPTDDPNWWSPTTNEDLTTGGKIGTFSASYSWYDSKRNIYGPRSKPQTVVFAAQYESVNVKLFGYIQTIPTPSVDEGYDVAVWASQAVFLDTHPTGWQDIEGTFLYQIQYQPDEYLSDVHFFETLGTIGAEVIFRKDNASLAASGRALDNFEPPHPADLMSIQPDGSTLYFYPNASRGGTGQRRHYVEYSVGHPEQVGRDRTAYPERRAANGPTVAPATGLRGKPLAAIDGRILLTDLGAHRIDFNGGSLNLPEITSIRGVRNPRSIAETPLGVMYMSDEGLTLIEPNGAVRAVDDLLAVAGYFEGLSSSERGEYTAIGAAGNRIFAFLPDTNPYTGQKLSSIADSALVYDHEQRALCRFKTQSLDIAYACGASLADGTKLMAFDRSASMYYWPSAATADDGTGFSCKLQLELNEQPEVNKRIKTVAVTFAGAQGSLSGNSAAPQIKVEAFNTPGNTADGYLSRTLSSANLLGRDIENRRSVHPAFTGMQGRYFRITIETGAWISGNLDIVQVEVEYEADASTIHGTT